MAPGKCCAKKSPFKQHFSFANRKKQIETVKEVFPTKVPVIVERFHKEVNLPVIRNYRFLVPKEMTFSQFLSVLRDRLIMTRRQTLYVLIKGKIVPSLATSFSELYEEYKDEDGFLYTNYASQEMFGSADGEGAQDRA
ncbi:microtubule-associated protein 1 light chain 3 alpha-like [Tachypleus tridentatus]|uniref:microtubule-associated protein 1 light chain 3 alpha-like n=1 Tax=Tachypleus tridentatus TaxID=6853 RepID=UPI003FD5B0C7